MNGAEEDPYSWGAEGANALNEELGKVGAMPTKPTDLQIMLRPDSWPYFIIPLVKSDKTEGCLMADGQGEWIIFRDHSMEKALDFSKGTTVSEGQLCKIVNEEGWSLR